MAPQVLILDYSGPDDFVIELKTKSQGDRLILAKIQPKASLAETVADVKIRSSSTNSQTCIPEDELAVPKFNFDITREYSEVEGAKLIVQNPKVARDLQVTSALQDIRFQMDEKGVSLKSESHMAFGCAKLPTPSHVMIFDKPFLIVLERVGATAPYFAMWVDNPELLVPW
jgi:serine protease inhibitor